MRYRDSTVYYLEPCYHRFSVSQWILSLSLTSLNADFTLKVLSDNGYNFQFWAAGKFQEQGKVTDFGTETREVLVKSDTAN